MTPHGQSSTTARDRINENSKELVLPCHMLNLAIFVPSSHFDPGLLGCTNGRCRACDTGQRTGPTSFDVFT